MKTPIFQNSLALLLAVLSFSSCTETLNVKPTSIITNESFWKTENDAEGALTGMYVKLRNEAQANLFMWGEARSEIMEWSRQGGTLNLDRYYLNTLDANFAGSGWLGLYAAIDAANLVLKYAPGIEFRQESQKNKTLAQAYTMRAFLYFVLVRTWGEVILRTEPTERYSPETVFLERSPREEIFQLIKADLEKALQLFPDNAFPSGRSMWSKPAANALKADVYLWTAKRLGGGQADFTTALNACDEAQKADVTLLPAFDAVFDYNNKGNKEVLMVSRFQNLESPNNYFDNMWIGSAGVPTGIDDETREVIGVPGSILVWMPTELVRNQFLTDDQRRGGSFWDVYQHVGGVPQYFVTIVLKGKGMVLSGVRHFKNDVILYRYADVLLMKAEAKNALNMDPSDEMNQVRARAFGSKSEQYAFVNGSKEANDAAILKERLLELAFEGKRWWDLVRFGKAFELVPSLQDRNGQEHLLVFPIGNSVLSLEPKVKQNQGY